MKRGLIITLFLILLIAGCSNQDSKEIIKEPEDLPQKAELPKEFIIGGALNPQLFLRSDTTPCLETANKAFNLVVDEGRMNWKVSEPTQGNVDFSMYQKSKNWADENNKPMRHHNLFWSNPEHVPDWAKELSDEELKQAIFVRINYTGDRIGKDISALDVINEMIAYTYFRDRLGESIIKDIYDETKVAFPNARLYINENPSHICIANDCTQIKSKEEYKDYMIKEFLGFLDYLEENEVKYDAIALQAHFTDKQIVEDNALFPYENSDNVILYDEIITEIYKKTGKKVLISEFDFRSNDEANKADFVHEFYNMALNHPYVEGIIYWSWFLPESKALVDDKCGLNAAGKTVVPI